MFPKLLILLVAMAASGAVLLSFRAERLAAEHEIAQLHEEIDVSRRAVWDAQVRVADDTGPEALRETLAAGGIEFEPARIQDAPDRREARYAAAPRD